MHLGEDLILHGKDGNPTTVLGPNSAVLNFAPKAAGSSKGELREVHLEGVTEIQKGGIVSDSVETISMPDVVNVGANAFKGFGWWRASHCQRQKPSVRVHFLTAPE